MQVGFFCSVALSLLGAVYLLTLALYFAFEGLAFPPSAGVQLVAGVVTFLTASVLVVLFAAIREVPGRDGFLGTVGLCFALLFAAVVSINRFVQLTVIRQAPDGPATSDLARFLPYSTTSVMFALEMLGWGFFLAIAALAVAPLFVGDGLMRSLRWTFVAFGVLSLASGIGYVTSTLLSMVGFVAWGPLLLALAIMLSGMYRRILREQSGRVT